MNMALAEFFDRFFGLEVGAADTAQFPTFEEALGICDLAIKRKERFRQFAVDETEEETVRSLRSVANHLVFLMARILDLKLQHRAHVHRQLVQNLMNAGLLLETAFVSTNYDILIDNALTELSPEVDLDYGLEFWNFAQPGEWRRPAEERAVRLLKPHGSLNWLLCGTCNQLRLTPKKKSVTRLISENVPKCPRCGTRYGPLIVPPTFYKDLDNVFLGTVWNKAELAFSEADHWVFCGYSFPDADMHIKYLLKRAQINPRRRVGVTVINSYPAKARSTSDEERLRYTRYLGARINFTGLSFEDFAESPATALTR